MTLIDDDAPRDRRRFWPTRREGFRLVGLSLILFGGDVLDDAFKLHGWAYWASRLVMIGAMYLHLAIEKRLFGPTRP